MKALICRISTRPHPDPKVTRIQVGICGGYRVIVGIDTPDGALGILFPAGSQLHPEFCLRQTLFRKHPNTGKKLGGYLCEKGRVRSIRLQGVESDGLWLPIDKIESLGDISVLKEGMLVNQIGTDWLCRKYVPNLRGSRKGSPGPRKAHKSSEYSNFREIGSTGQLRNYLSTLPAGAIITITEKLHGTSGRTGFHKRRRRREELKNPLTRLLAKGVEWLVSKLPVEERDAELDKFYGTIWEKVTGTRRTVLTNIPKQDRKQGDYRRAIHDTLAPKKGETIYYEIVGYAGSTSTPIMARHSVADKELKKQYGEQITYTYGLALGQFEIYIYKITETNLEGDEIVLSPAQMKARAQAMGIKAVPHLETLVYDGQIEDMIDHLNGIADGPSTLDPSHPREGVCCWVQHPEMPSKVLKWKGFAFSLLEEIAYSDPNFSDIEEDDGVNEVAG